MIQQRLHRAHEVIHRAKELTIAIAVEVDLKGIHARLLPVAHQIGGDFCRRAAPGRALGTRGYGIAGNLTEFYPEAHARFRRMLSADPSVGLPQQCLTLEQFGHRRRPRLQYVGERRGAASLRPPTQMGGCGWRDGLD
jgi:hypothetical protein